MRYTVAALTFSLWLALAMPSIPKEEPLSAEGVVVAIQRGEGDLRLVDPNSAGDLAEIYMMRVDLWSQPQKQKYIIVEYIHRADLISYEQFDKTRWRFEVHQASAEETKDCLSWMARGPSFLPTAFGAKDELPNPTELSCFLMTKRPVPVRQRKAASTVESRDGSLHLEIPVVGRVARIKIVTASGSKPVKAASRFVFRAGLRCAEGAPGSVSEPGAWV